MNNSRRAPRAAFGLALLSLLPSTVSFAGSLAEFEKAATHGNDIPRATASDRDGKNDDDYWLVAVLDIVGDVVSYGGSLSLARVGHVLGVGAVAPRETGSADLPFIRFDFAYQDLESDVDAFDGRVEAGYGPAAVQYRLTRMRQGSTQEHLKLSYAHGLYRISGSDAFEFALGLGQVVLEGEARSSGASFTVPLNIYPLPEIGIRLVPTWSDINGNTIRDYDASVAYVPPYFSLRLGYREITSHQETLRGPYAGVSFHY